MSISLGQSIARAIFWRYQRGSWQYDILCGLILVFIFLTPKSVFNGSYFKQDETYIPTAVVIEADQEKLEPEQKQINENEINSAGS